jgi:hypothetical protein
LTVSALLASGYHAPIIIAIPIIVAVVLAKVVYSKSRGRPAVGGRVIVRCSKGHLFTANWSPLGSLTSIRLGYARFQRCPVGNHWALLRPVNVGDLSEEERQIAATRGG